MRHMMNKLKLACIIAFLLSVGIGWGAASGLASDAAQSGTVPVSMVVSIEAKHGGEIPTINREDVRVTQGKTRLRVTDWLPLQGDQAALQLFVLLDDADRTNISLQFDDLRQFMGAQAASTSIGVAYMQYGAAEIVQNPTTDRVLAEKALRLPLSFAGVSGSPYESISDLIKRWPESTARREIFLVSSGIDRLYGSGPDDPYLTEAIDQAQRAQIQIYAIYASEAGHFGHSYWSLNWGQNDLSRLAEETGGEFYVQGTQTPIEFKPFLDQFADRLTHQYRVTFLATPEKKAGYQRVALGTEVPNAELVSSDRVYVPAAK
jgi:hypothetical protein